MNNAVKIERSAEFDSGRLLIVSRLAKLTNGAWVNVFLVLFENVIPNEEKSNILNLEIYLTERAALSAFEERFKNDPTQLASCEKMSRLNPEKIEFYSSQQTEGEE